MQLLVGVLGVAGAVLTTLLTVRQAGRKARIDTTQQIIDQLQENAVASDARHQVETDKLEGRYLRELVEVRQEMTDVKDRMARMEDRELTLQDYVASLRYHIDAGKGPPPPPWPGALMHRPRGEDPQ